MPVATSPAPRELQYERPWLYEKQREFLFAPERYSIVEASTKTGKTVGCMVWLFEQAALHGAPGRNYWWVAPTFGVAKIAYRRLKRAIPPDLYAPNETELTLTLPNGAVMWFKGADKPDSLYGEDVYAAVVDEATRCKEESWYAVRSTLTATRGPVRIIGNVKGRKNWAYQLARKAESGEPDMHYSKLTAYDAADAGVLAREEIEDAKRTLPDAVFRELYLAEPTDDGGNPFGMDAIRGNIAELSTAEPAVWGWDLAKSYDWTVGIALDAHGTACRLARFQKPWQETIREIDRLTGRTPALVDSTGVGDPVLESLQRPFTESAARDGGPAFIPVTARRNFEGFTFTATSKQQLMEGLAVAIQQGQIRYPAGVIVSELEQFEYMHTRTGVRYSAPDGLHDDAVMALALAWRAFAERGRTVPRPRSGYSGMSYTNPR